MQGFSYLTPYSYSNKHYFTKHICIYPIFKRGDSSGKLLTDSEDIKTEAMRHYTKVFADKPIDEELKMHKLEREKAVPRATGCSILQ